MFERALVQFAGVIQIVALLGCAGTVAEDEALCDAGNDAGVANQWKSESR
jgi:hypothetical protein